MEKLDNRSRKRQRNDSNGEHLEDISHIKRYKSQHKASHNAVTASGGTRQNKMNKRKEAAAVVRKYRHFDRRISAQSHEELYVSSVQPVLESEIIEISQLEENDMVSKLSLKTKGFQELLDKEYLLKRPSVMNAVLTILTKSTQVVEKAKHVKITDLCQKANKIVGEVLNDRRSVFQLKLKIYLQEQNWQYPSLFQICSLFCKLLEIFPLLSWSVLPVKELESIIMENEPGHNTVEQLDSNTESLQDKVQTMVSLYESAKESPVSTGNTLHQKQSDSKYKDIPIMPTWNEIIQIRPTSRKLLRENRIRGSYDDWLNYCDIHFRLLREDFVAPLREGVKDYLKGLRGRKLNNIKVYNDIRLLNLKCSESGICFTIGLGRVPKSSKRLINGSLVCLSHDNFKEDVFFATVDSQKRVARGMIDLLFHGVSSAHMLQFMSKVFVMVESSAFFGEYGHILHRLQTAEGSTMPFTKYLIDAECTTVNKPQYLNDNSKASYNLTHLLKHRDDEDGMSDQKEKTYSKIRDICDSSIWPPLDSVDLDKSQLEALKYGLTQEISVIQGPPGTGKTYIGLKIVETLLKNTKCWNTKKKNQNKSPILVMCYKNHALDQFLEGLLDCSLYKDKKKNIPLVRIGFGSKRERLQNLSIHNKRKYVNLPYVTYNERGWAIRRSKQCKQDIQMLWDKYKLSLVTILPLTYLYDFLDPNHEYFFHYGKQNPEEKFLFWITENIPSHSTLDKYPKHHESVQKRFLGNPSFQVHRNQLFDYSNGNQQHDFNDDKIVYQGVDNNANYHSFGYKRKAWHLQCEIPNIIEWQESLMLHKWKRTQALHYMSMLEPMTEHEAKEVQDLSQLPWKKRLMLYKYLLVKYQNDLTKKLDLKFQEYELSCEEVKRVTTRIDYSVLRRASVIGMTTTGAAKNQHLLQLVKPRIIIVEEAAEVLESHIVSALTSNTQHLILIGDHKQLRPKCNVFKLAKIFRLDVSLFERLILNGHSHVTLNIQHRMRPEIAELVHPHIYDTLHNHASVKEYPNVRGVGTNLFFINHEQMESEVDRECSHSNDHEVDFLVALCKYLLQQDYSTSQITILVTYSGQLLKMKKKIAKDRVQRVRVSTVDDFQGEENDIILLSLVRSNKENDVGFLKKENRVCVAMSRARQGFYCIGNFHLLRTCSDTWERIMKDMESKGKIGNQLKLQCHNHPEQTFMASSSEDFDNNIALGGCPKECLYRLPCGHVCSEKCHVSDPDHKSYKCTKICSQKCLKGHPCPLECYQKCKPCTKIITVTLSCEHKKNIECSADPSKVVCKEKCSKQCPMNHPCKKLCHEDCGNCEVEVLKVMEDCNHEVHLPCHIPPLHMNCTKMCEKLLPCNHKCALKCGQVCSNGKCPELVQVTLKCEHKSEIACWKQQTGIFDSVSCSSQCDKILPCNHRCTNYCSDPCTEKCEVLVDKSYPCGHFNKDHCYKTVCGKACEKFLKCGHPCPNLCGEPCANKCLEKVQQKYPCGHEMIVSCSSSHQDNPCTRNVWRVYPCGHQIKVKCSSSYTDAPCTTTVLKEFPCGHKIEVKCSSIVSDASCKINVLRKYPCGHSMKVKCSSTFTDTPCTTNVLRKYPCGHSMKVKCSSTFTDTPCTTNVLRKYPCGHKMRVRCSSTFTDTPCTNLCEQMLMCGHKCEGECYRCKSSNVHKTCTFKVELERFCGHKQKVTCAGLGDIVCKETLKVSCAHGHKHIPCSSSRHLPYLTCQMPCQWQCDHHTCSRQCYEECDRPPCNKLCNKKLKCGHPCHGLCGEPCLKYCPVCERTEFSQHLKKATFFNKNKQYYQLTCGHIFVVGYLDGYIRKFHEESPCEVHPLFCPEESCRTPMSTSFRYNDAVKSSLRRICDVREKIFPNEELLSSLKHGMLDPLLYPDRSYFRFLEDFLYNYQSWESRNKSEWLYLVSLLLKTVIVKKMLHNFTCSIKSELEEQVKTISSLIRRGEGLTYSVVQDMEQNYMRQYLKSQVLLAKERCTYSVESITKAEMFLKDMVVNCNKIKGTKECFYSHLEHLAYDFPEIVISTGLPSDIEIRYPVLQKGMWWSCAEGHYYCVPPVTTNATTRHHCPECAGSFFNYVQLLSDARTLEEEAKPKSRKLPIPQDAIQHRQGERSRLTPHGGHSHYYPVQQHPGPGSMPNNQIHVPGRSHEKTPMHGQRVPKRPPPPHGRRDYHAPQPKRGRIDSSHAMNTTNPESRKQPIPQDTTRYRQSDPTKRSWLALHGGHGYYQDATRKHTHYYPMQQHPSSMPDKQHVPGRSHEKSPMHGQHQMAPPRRKRPPSSPGRRDYHTPDKQHVPGGSHEKSPMHDQHQMALPRRKRPPPSPGRRDYHTSDKQHVPGGSHEKSPMCDQHQMALPRRKRPPPSPGRQDYHTPDKQHVPGGSHEKSPMRDQHQMALPRRKRPPPSPGRRDYHAPEPKRGRTDHTHATNVSELRITDRSMERASHGNRPGNNRNGTGFIPRDARH